MTKQIKISAEELSKLYEKKKLTTYQIAEKFNCCQATVWKRLKEFNINLRLAGVKRVNISEKKLKDLYLNKKFSTWKIERITQIPRGSIHRKLKEYGLKIRDRADSHIIFPRENFSGDLVEKAYLIGFRLGDLGVRKIYPNSKTICVASGSTIKEQIDLINSLFKQYGRVRSKKTRYNKINIWIALNESFDFLLTKEIPSWVEGEKKLFLSFLAGFSDAEGNIGIYNNQAVFQIGNYDKNLLLFIAKNMNNLGIVCRGPYGSNMKNYTHKEGYHYNQNYFQIRVGKKDSLLKLFGMIKPYLKHKNKIKALKKAEDNIIYRNKLKEKK